MHDGHLDNVKTLLLAHEERFRSSAQRWKIGYRSLLITSAVTSTSSALIGKIGFFGILDQSDVAAVLAGVTTIITTMIAVLNFDVNWKINRRSRHDIQSIQLDAEKSGADPDQLLGELQQVIRRRSSDLTKPD